MVLYLLLFCLISNSLRNCLEQLEIVSWSLPIFGSLFVAIQPDFEWSWNYLKQSHLCSSLIRRMVLYLFIYFIWAVTSRKEIAFWCIVQRSVKLLIAPQLLCLKIFIVFFAFPRENFLLNIDHSTPDSDKHYSVQYIHLTENYLILRKKIAF